MYSKCPVFGIGNHTVVKHASQALIAYLYYLINNNMGQGYCPFHHTVIAKQDTKECKSNNQLELSMGVPLQSKYVWYTKILPVTLTGDAGPVKNVTRFIHHLCGLMLQILGLGQSISQSIACGVCLLISTLSESDPLLTPIVQQVGSTLSDKGVLAVKCEQENTFVCMRYKRFNVADWKFTFMHLNLSVGVSADYSMIELVWWDNGIPYGVSKDEFYKCLMTDYINPLETPTFEECKMNKFTGLVLSDKHVLKYWGEQTDGLVNEQKQIDAQNGNLHLWNDPKYERKQRVNICQHKTHTHHGILTAMDTPLGSALVDCAHCFWSWIG